LGKAKLYSATEAAHRSRFNVAHLVERQSFKLNAVGSIPTINKNAKSASVVCEKHLMLDTQVNQVHRSSQGESGLY
jgi:hypothetical protein